MKWLKFIKGPGGSLGRDKHRNHGPPDKATRYPLLMEDLGYCCSLIPGDLGIYTVCKMDHHESCRTDLGLRLAREL